jgi:transposase
MLKEQKQFNKAYLIRAACEGIYTVREVAERLNFSQGWVKQLKANYRKRGDQAFIHGNIGHIPPHKVPDSIRKKIIELKITDTFIKANFLHFTEILAEEGIAYSYTTIRNILLGAEIKSPKYRRPKKEKQLHLPRPRREAFGEMLQADASPFNWLGAGELSLHGYVDDATGSITGLWLSKNECLTGYLEVTRQTIENFGIPGELYPDKASVFFTTVKAEGLTIEEQLEGIMHRKTQLGRIMEELGVNMHPAHSPQAKGRIERLWETLQSRLPVEFKRLGIYTIEAANAYLPVFIRKYNAQFAVKPAKNQSAFIRLYDTSVLDMLLAAKIERKTDSQGIFSFHNYRFVVPHPACRGKKITLLLSEQLGFKAMIGTAPKLYDIEPCRDLNKHVAKTHMPEVTKELLEKYLASHAKETTQPGDIFAKKAGSW